MVKLAPPGNRVDQGGLVVQRFAAWFAAVGRQRLVRGGAQGLHRARRGPVAVGDALVQAEQGRDLRHFHAGEEPALDDLHQPRLQPRQRTQRVLDLQAIQQVRCIRHRLLGHQGDLQPVAAALDRLPPAHMVHDHLPHDLAGQRHEAALLAGIQRLPVHLQEGFVDQRHRVQAGPPAVAQLAAGQPRQRPVQVGEAFADRVHARGHMPIVVPVVVACGQPMARLPACKMQRQARRADRPRGRCRGPRTRGTGRRKSVPGAARQPAPHCSRPASGKVAEPAGKPGSVWDSHSSGRRVAATL